MLKRAEEIRELSPLKVVSDNSNKVDEFLAQGDLDYDMCNNFFNGYGYDIDGLNNLSSCHALISKSGHLILDWEGEEEDDYDYIINQEDGCRYNLQEEIIYEIDPDLLDNSDYDKSAPRGFLVGIDGGKVDTDTNKDTVGMRQLRANMKAYDSRTRGSKTS